MSKLLSEWKGTASNLKTVQELEAKYNKLAEDMVWKTNIVFI